MIKDCVLAIDNGTQSVRALVFDTQGNLLAKSRVVIEPYYSTSPGLAEQDPQVFWKAVCSACQQLWTLSGSYKERIAGVSLTTQRSTVVNVDSLGRPLRPAIVWLDQRRTPGLKPVGGLWGVAFRLTGMSETVAHLQADAEANWIRTYQPEIWENTHKFLFLSGYLTFLLIGKFVDSIGSQVGYVPFDYQHQRWASNRDWKWQAVPMKKNILPDLVPPSHSLGEITELAAEATGIPAGLPLIAAAADKACEVIGAGCLKPNIACLSYGTTATINTTNQRYIELIPLIPPYPAAIPGSYSLETQIYRGYWMVSWFTREFAQDETRLAQQRGVEVEELFDELVESVSPGSNGLMLQPFWSPGLKVPGPEAKGAIIGFGDIHTRSHLYRSILEGLAYGLREGAEMTVKRSGVRINEIRVAGGGSQSHAAMQLTADIFGLPASNPHVYEASGLGAAIDAAVGLGLHPDFDKAVSAMTRTSRTFEPIPANQKIYDELYKHVYCHMYERLKPLYEKIRSITGYPPTD
ncbi:MAG TPA: FGGY-family carbohydrate kinase [Anaerolineaceae bacterium]|nr:FGGY-family carbohydrate kinase [Anaerolineaceae bacterium]